MKIGKWVNKSNSKDWLNVIWVDPTGKVGLGISGEGHAYTYSDVDMETDSYVFQEPELKVDDEVEVSDDGKDWQPSPRHFAFKNPHGEGVYCYRSDLTSKQTDHVIYWKYWRRK